MDGVERVPVKIPKVEVVGTFNVKAFLDGIYNPETKRKGVRASVTLTRKEDKPIRREEIGA